MPKKYRSMIEMKTSAATTPTNTAAIHSMVSMKRSAKRCRGGAPA